MCLIVLFTRQFDTCPLVLGANREERYGRPSTAPRWLGGTPDVFAGQDQIAGGTWLGVNGHGVVVAITNRRARRDAPGADLDGDRDSNAGLDGLRHNLWVYDVDQGRFIERRSAQQHTQDRRAVTGGT